MEGSMKNALDDTNARGRKLGRDMTFNPLAKGFSSGSHLDSAGLRFMCQHNRDHSPVDTERVRYSSRINLVVIGSSTGGPAALAEILPALPKHFPIPILIVQHMPAAFTKCLGEDLSMKSVIPVAEARGGTLLRPGQAWIAPGDFHVTVRSRGMHVELVTNQEPPEHFCRPSVDVLFRSVAEVYGAGALAIVLTGMGKDGVSGARAIRAQGGHVLVQDEATSVVWGMPGAVVRAGLANDILPLSRISDELLRLVRMGGGSP
jgi:two-component system, chemotaxis family, protein-glutamate methylesterase/glutaminase